MITSPKFSLWSLKHQITCLIMTLDNTAKLASPIVSGILTTYTLTSTSSGEMEDLIPTSLNITSKSNSTLNSITKSILLVSLKLSESVMEVDMIDTCVSEEEDHISEPGLDLDGMVTSTESMYGITNSIHGNSSPKMDKDRRLILTVFWLVLTVTTTLISIGQTQ